MERAKVVECVETRKYFQSAGDFYSNPDVSGVLGLADQIILHVIISDFSGTSPDLDIVVEDSADGENWSQVGSTLISSPTISVPTTLRGVVDGPFARFVRFKCTIGGSSSPTLTVALRATLKYN